MSTSREKQRVGKGALVRVEARSLRQEVLPGDSLEILIQLYGKLEAGANAANTFQAKSRDLGLFMKFFGDKVETDDPDDWTKSITAAFLRELENTQKKKATTVNRVLATLRHCSAWINRRRAFLAGDPCQGIKELVTDEAAWKGLSDVEVMRLRSAAEQLVKLKDRKDQNAVRDLAIFQVLLQTGLRVSELLALDRGQYDGKHFLNVKRKGRIRTGKVFLPKEAREALDAYLADRKDDPTEPLLCSQAGMRLDRAHVHRILKQLAAQANSKLAKGKKICLSAHVLRHTFLRKVTEKHGVNYAMEAAGHASSKYIWRYVKPSDEEKEKALEGLF